MGPPWALIISLVILGLALLIKYLFSEIIEEQNIFLIVVIVFIVIYVIAAFAVGKLNPLDLTHNISDQL